MITLNRLLSYIKAIINFRKALLEKYALTDFNWIDITTNNKDLIIVSFNLDGDDFYGSFDYEKEIILKIQTDYFYGLDLISKIIIIKENYIDIPNTTKVFRDRKDESDKSKIAFLEEFIVLLEENYNYELPDILLKWIDTLNADLLK